MAKSQRRVPKRFLYVLPPDLHCIILPDSALSHSTSCTSVLLLLLLLWKRDVSRGKGAEYA